MLLALARARALDGVWHIALIGNKRIRSRERASARLCEFTEIYERNLCGPLFSGDDTARRRRTAARHSAHGVSVVAVVVDVVAAPAVGSFLESGFSGTMDEMRRRKHSLGRTSSRKRRRQ